MDAIAEHGIRCDALAAGLRATNPSGVPVGLRKTTSNLFRHRADAEKYRLDVRSFDRVLSIDAEGMTATVEGMTTYGTLVDETLRYGLLPAVVPELKTITVGGAVSGLGIESSSLKYGLVHETVEEMVVLTGDGRLVACSPSSNRDLFFGFPNSYGTLGYVLRLKIRLVPAQRYVRVRHTRFSNARDFFAAVTQFCDRGAADFLDGTIFGPGEMYVSEGILSDEAPRVSNYTYMQIYYRSIQRKQTDWLTSKGYIWRWDTDWFWCSKHFGVQKPVIRFFSKWALNSRNYQRLMRLSHKLLPAGRGLESVIQDVHVPIENAPAFCDFLLTEIDITPVWVCPFKSSYQSYHLCGLKKNRLYINFGFWDMVPTTNENGYYNRMIEQQAAALEGRKGLYSNSYYDRKTFWTLYDKACYDELKSRYDPDGRFPDLYAKCVERK